MEDTKTVNPPLSVTDLLGDFSIVFPNQLSTAQNDWFWKQGVNMDDWDDMLIVPGERITESEKTDREWDTGELVKTIVLDVDDWSLQRLLTGCCDNRWYRVRFREGERGIGVAYHA